MGQRLFDNEPANRRSQRTANRDESSSSLDSHEEMIDWLTKEENRVHYSFSSGQSEQRHTSNRDRDHSTQHIEQPSHEDSRTTQNLINQTQHFSHASLSAPRSNGEGEEPIEEVRVRQFVDRGSSAVMQFNHQMEGASPDMHLTDSHMDHGEEEEGSDDEGFWDERHQAELRHHINTFQILSESVNNPFASTTSPPIYSESLHDIFLRYINHAINDQISQLPPAHRGVILHHNCFQLNDVYVSSMDSSQTRTIIERLIADLRAARAAGVSMRWSSAAENAFVSFARIIDRLGGPTRILWEQLLVELRAISSRELSTSVLRF